MVNEDGMDSTRPTGRGPAKRGAIGQLVGIAIILDAIEHCKSADLESAEESIYTAKLYLEKVMQPDDRMYLKYANGKLNRARLEKRYESFARFYELPKSPDKPPFKFYA